MMLVLQYQNSSEGYDQYCNNVSYILIVYLCLGLVIKNVAKLEVISNENASLYYVNNRTNINSIWEGKRIFFG